MDCGVVMEGRGGESARRTEEGTVHGDNRR